MGENLVVNEYLVRDFLRNVIIELRPYEVLTAVIVTRKKYCKEISRSEELVAFEILVSDEMNYILSRLKRLGYVEDIYRDKKTGKPFPKEAFAMYIDLHPKDTIEAFRKLVYEGLDDVYRALKSQEPKDLHKFALLHRHWFSALCRSRSRKPYYIIDIDNKDFKLLEYFIDILGDEIVSITETRGGYHIIANNVDPNVRIFTKGKQLMMATKGKPKNWVPINTGETVVEVHYNQAQTPVPGTIQGGKLVDIIRR